MARARKGLKAPVKKQRKRRPGPRPMQRNQSGEIWLEPTPAEAEALAALFGTEGRIVAFGMSDNLKT